jgi:hypothetical protein
MQRTRDKLTYSNVVSTLCLVLLLGGGTAYAATHMLPKNSVGSKQIKKGAITPAKLSKAARSSLIGPVGATGAQGPKGDTGATGPSSVYASFHDGPIQLEEASNSSPLTVATLNSLPPGSYAIQAKLLADSESSLEDLTQCTLAAEGDRDAANDYLGHQSVGDSYRTVFPLQIVHTFPGPGVVTIRCGHDVTAQEAFVEDIKITAIKVGGIAANTGG